MTNIFEELKIHENENKNENYSYLFSEMENFFLFNLISIYENKK